MSDEGHNSRASDDRLRLLIAHRIALDPTNKQRTYFARASGTARFAWNWALAEWQRQYAARREDESLPQPSDAGLRWHAVYVQAAQAAIAAMKGPAQ